MSYGLPDLGITNLERCPDRSASWVTDATDLPVLVDDTGFGGAFTIARLVRGLIMTGAAAMHMEDQVAQTLRTPPRQGNCQQGRNA